MRLAIKVGTSAYIWVLTAYGKLLRRLQLGKMRRLIPTHLGVLIAACMSMWAVNCVYDLPASLSEPLRSHLSLDESQYAYLISLLYTVYSAPNTILPFFSGALTQRFGERQVWCTTGACLVVGQLACAFGVQLRQVWLIILGRVVIGLGAEIIGVLGYDVVTRWYSDKKLSLALAIALGVPRLGSVTNSIVTPALIDRHGVTSATWTVTVVPVCLTILSACYMAPLLSTAQKASVFEINVTSIKLLPRPYWQLAYVCVSGYACINTFGNSAQRFLAAWFFNGDQAAAGRSLSFAYLISVIIVPISGVLLEMSWLSIPLSLIISSAVMALAHLALSLRMFGAVIPLLSLGTAYALFGTAFWAGVACSLLGVEIPEPAPLSESQVLLLDPGKLSQPTLESLSESQISILIDGSDLGRAELAQGENNGGELEELTATGFGIVTSVLNTSCALTPMVLAGVESAFGYFGLEFVFVLLASFTCYASITLLRMGLGG